MTNHDSDLQQQGLGELMARYLDGDERAFAALYPRVERIIRSQVRRRVSHGPTVDDLVQLTVLKAHMARSRYEAPTTGDRDRAVAVWYAAIARNSALDHVRRRYRDAVLGVDPSTVVNSTAGNELDAEQMAIETERREDIAVNVQRALARLPEAQRTVVTMHKLEGKGMARIASELGVRSGTLRVRAHRGYKALARSLGHMRLDSPPAVACM